LGALPAIWQLQDAYDEESFREEGLHDRLEKQLPKYRPLLNAIRGYESFARSLQDAFDVLKAEAAGPDDQGFVVSEIASDKDFKRSVSGLHNRFETAHRALGEVAVTNLSIQNLFIERFQAFSEPMEGAECARALCQHYLKIQQGKSADGKRPWFDRLGPDRIYIRHAIASLGGRSPQVVACMNIEADQSAAFAETCHEPKGEGKRHRRHARPLAAAQGRWRFDRMLGDHLHVRAWIV
jgi:hypothetical protein